MKSVLMAMHRKLIVPCPRVADLSVPPLVKELVLSWTADPCYDLIPDSEPSSDDVNNSAIWQYRRQLRNFVKKEERYVAWRRMGLLLTQMEELGVLSMAEQMVDMKNLLDNLRSESTR